MGDSPGSVPDRRRERTEPFLFLDPFERESDVSLATSDRSEPLVPRAAEHRFGQLSPRDFKAAFRFYPLGVSLITADAGAGPVAFTASSVSAVNDDPALLMFSASSRSSSSPTLLRADTIVVHLLDAESLDLAKLGAARGVDRFADRSRWERLVTGEPYFPKARSWIRARILNRMDAGGSTVIVAQGIQSSVRADDIDDLPARDGLVYLNRTWHRIGDHSRTE